MKKKSDIFAQAKNTVQCMREEKKSKENLKSEDCGPMPALHTNK